jgi:hypothetical protein
MTNRPSDRHQTRRMHHTAPLPAEVVLGLCAFPVIVWGVDECYRAWPVARR